MPSGKAKEARAFGSPSRYIQGPGELRSLPKFAANYGNTALVIIDAFFFDEFGKHSLPCSPPPECTLMPLDSPGKVPLRSWNG